MGKSTVALVLAREFAAQGKKTLLVEIGDHSFYAYLLKQPIHYQPTRFDKNLEVAHWSSQECLKSYALSLLKVEALYRLFFENPVMRSLIQVAPALTELAIAGQITSSPRNHGPHGDHEVLVVDAYATGHFLQLIQAPKAMGETINRGPMGDQSRQIYAVFKDFQMCQLHLVTTAEELPITEVLELYRDVRKIFNWPVEIILNRFLKTSLSSDQISNPSGTLLQQVIRDKLLAQQESIQQLKQTQQPLRSLALLPQVGGFSDLPQLESM